MDAAHSPVPARFWALPGSPLAVRYRNAHVVYASNVPDGQCWPMDADVRRESFCALEADTTAAGADAPRLTHALAHALTHTPSPTRPHPRLYLRSASQPPLAIMNRHRVRIKPMPARLHSLDSASDSSADGGHSSRPLNAALLATKLVPSLQQVWEDETRRRRDRGQLSQPTQEASQDRPDAVPVNGLVRFGDALRALLGGQPVAAEAGGAPAAAVGPGDLVGADRAPAAAAPPPPPPDRMAVDVLDALALQDDPFASQLPEAPRAAPARTVAAEPDLAWMAAAAPAASASLASSPAGPSPQRAAATAGATADQSVPRAPTLPVWARNLPLAQQPLWSADMAVPVRPASNAPRPRVPLDIHATPGSMASAPPLVRTPQHTADGSGDAHAHHDGGEEEEGDGVDMAAWHATQREVDADARRQARETAATPATPAAERELAEILAWMQHGEGGGGSPGPLGTTGPAEPVLAGTPAPADADAMDVQEASDAVDDVEPAVVDPPSPQALREAEALSQWLYVWSLDASALGG